MTQWQGLSRDERLHSDPHRAYFDCIEELLTPVLRADGFRGSRRTFRRVRGEAIHVIWLQSVRTGDSVVVNLGVHLQLLPIYDGSLPDPRSIDEPSCEFRKRLMPERKGDYCWPYGSSPTETEASVRHMIQTYEDVGRKHFELIGEFPGVYATLSLDDLLGGASRNPLLYLGGPPVRLARSLSLVALHLGQNERAVSLAEWGLAILRRDRRGPGKAMIPVLAAVLRAASNPKTSI